MEVPKLSCVSCDCHVTMSIIILSPLLLVFGSNLIPHALVDSGIASHSTSEELGQLGSGLGGYIGPRRGREGEVVDGRGEGLLKCTHIEKDTDFRLSYALCTSAEAVLLIVVR